MISDRDENLAALKLKVYEDIHKMVINPSAKTAEDLQINFNKLHNMNALIAKDLKDFYLLHHTRS